MSKNGVFKSDHNSTDNGSFQKSFCIRNFSVRSTNVPNFLKIQNTWCNPFALLAWNDPSPVVTQTLGQLWHMGVIAKELNTVWLIYILLQSIALINPVHLIYEKKQLAFNFWYCALQSSAALWSRKYSTTNLSNMVLLLQPLGWWHCMECMIHHERDVQEEKHPYMWCEQAIIKWPWHVTSIVACCHNVKLCALAAQTFQSQQMMLWPGCKSRARCRFHKRKVRPVRFIVKKKGRCCYLPDGVALNMWFTKNGMCVKNNTHLYVVRTSNNRVIMACDLYCCLLPVWSFGHLLLGLSNSSTTNWAILCKCQLRTIFSN